MTIPKGRDRGKRWLVTSVSNVAAAALALVAGCQPSVEPGRQEPRQVEADCWRTVSDASAAASALAIIEPGQRLCLSGDGLAEADLSVDRSGKEGAPVILSGFRTPVRSIEINADQVVVQGLTLVGEGGLEMSGRGLGARDLLLPGGRGAIVCEHCTDVVIEGNEVTGADGAGIYVIGERVTVRNNTVAGSVAISGDADGIRFFGIDLLFADNIIRDIKDDGYPDGGRPHTDCFQTYDNDRPTTYRVVIKGNRCSNVDHQCLIATGDDRGNRGVPPGVRSIVFANNVCEVEGSQAVLLRSYPGVDVRDNELSATDHGAVITEGSTDVTVTGNVGTLLDANADLVYVDGSSRRGFQQEDNRATR
jgi:hypothetical protein